MAKRHTLLTYLPAREQGVVRDFFAAFAAAEFDLKRMGYIRRGAEVAQADWDGFASDIHQRFRIDRPPQIARAWRDLTGNPPRKQVVIDGRLGWRPTDRPRGVSDAEWGLLLVRRVRNNLFHGGKFIVGGNDQFVRDRHLVEAAHIVLDMTLSLMPRKRR